MGQGLHTKIIQIAAECFKIPHEMVVISETSSSTVANSSPTAASSSIDLYGMAVLDACEQILARLKPIEAKLALSREGMQPTWLEIVQAAFFDRIQLSAQGYYVIDGNRCGYDWNKTLPSSVSSNPYQSDNDERGTPFNYFTQGVACTEVEIDCLTGNVQLLRADIVMDLGKTINPALDIGQIEGAYIQGYGYCTMEEMIWG